MKTTNLLSYLCLLIFPIFMGCEKEEPRIGKGDDPILNIVEYAFPKEGGSLEVYSTINYGLHVLPTEADAGEKVDYSFVGSWFKITWDTGNKKLQIEVEPNDTGRERKLPVDVCAGNFHCNTNYIQKAE